MRLQLPSTHALRAFEVVARYLNCTHAAQELCLTTSAVSKQLQSLEETLGVKLFTRGKHGLKLTEAGETYLNCIKPVMANLAEAGTKISGSRPNSKSRSIRVLPAFADRWLIPRLADFSDANPDLQIDFNASLEPEEALLPSFDAHIRYGSGFWPGCESVYICGSQLIIVGSPSLLNRRPAVQSPSDFNRFPLIEHVMAPLGWRQALTELGVILDKSALIVQWDFYSVLIRSACVGHGLALVPKCFVTEDLANGTLVQVLEISLRCPFGYYFTCPPERWNDGPIVRFREWLLSRRSEGESLAG